MNSNHYLGVRIRDSERVAVAADSHGRAVVVLVLDLGFDFVADPSVAGAFDSGPVVVAPGRAVDVVSAARLGVATHLPAAAVVAIVEDASAVEVHSLAVAAVAVDWSLMAGDYPLALELDAVGE